MSSLKRYFAAFAVLLIGAVTLTGCSGYNFYKDWSEAGATIEKDHIFEAISLDEAKSKIDNDETFVLVLGTSEASSAKNSITVLQQQADYFEFDKKLYFINATSYLSKISDRKTLQETLGITDSSKISSNIVVVCYNRGEIVLDTSKKTDDASLENFVSSGSINYQALASYLFNDFIYN